MTTATAAPAISELHADGEVISFSTDYQGVTLWLGDRYPVHISDDTEDIDIADLVAGAGQRAVTVARLRRIADVLERA